eukprot:c8921_g1_i1.p1 GENE.c8921_g1_i1~~c8921_g1_i1.p1  ORF type:complete len:425 (+),score=105.61 c8921_g1_i1:37-1275(+)
MGKTGQASKFTINVDTSTPKEAAPLLASFANSRPEAVGDLGGVADMQFQLFQHSAGRKRMLVANDSAMEWQATNFGSQSSKHNLCNYAIGVFDPETKQVKLYPVDSVYDMDQAVIGKRKKMEDGTTKKVNKSYMEQRNQLIEQFGASKAKRRVAAAQANIISSEAISQVSDVRSTIKQTAADNTDLLHQNEDRNLPPHNREATTPEEAYVLEDLITTELWNELDPKELFEAVKKPSMITEWRESKRYPDYVLEKIPVLGNITGEDRDTKGKLLLMISMLVNLRNARKRKFGSKKALEELLPWVPPSAIDYFCLTFYSQSPTLPGFMQDDRLQDLLLLYVLVFALHVENFNFSSRSLQADLGFTSTQMRKYLMALGCTVLSAKSGESSVSATLSTPLTFPEMGKRKGGARGRK